MMNLEFFANIFFENLYIKMKLELHLELQINGNITFFEVGELNCR